MYISFFINVSVSYAFLFEVFITAAALIPFSFGFFSHLFLFLAISVFLGYHRCFLPADSNLLCREIGSNSMSVILLSCFYSSSISIIISVVTPYCMWMKLLSVWDPNEWRISAFICIVLLSSQTLSCLYSFEFQLTVYSPKIKVRKRTIAWV